MTATSPIPLSRQLIRMNMLVSGAALLLACAAFAAYDLMTFRESTVRNLSIQAEIAGSNSVTALLFDDAPTAGETLASLDASPDIVSAHVYAADGELFASYWRGGTGAGATAPVLGMSAGQTEVHAFGLSSLTLARRIVFEGKDLGVLVIQADLQALYERLTRYLVIVGIVLLVSLLAALLVSRLAQRSISRPLTALAAVARQVSAEEQRYGLRAVAEPGASGEVSSLIDSFNEMLARMQARDRSLQHAQQELETRVRQRTAELHATNQELEAFSYSVSHDLRAPLRHIVGFAALLTQNATSALSERERRHLQTIADAANRMARLIDDLLAFSRMGRAGLNPQLVDLAAIVRDAQAEVASDTAGRGIVWEIQPLPAVYADPSLLRPVMVNLLSNAIKYSGTRNVARIEIGTLPSDGPETVVFVRDNGVGFDMKYVNKLFGVFQRLHRADEFSGTGIGLANVRRIISRHGGRTWAEGRPDDGATFYFALPLAPDVMCADASETRRAVAQ